MTEVVAGLGGERCELYGAGQPAKESPPGAPLAASSTTLPLFKHKHPQTSTTRALEMIRELQYTNSKGQISVCVL